MQELYAEGSVAPICIIEKLGNLPGIILYLFMHLAPPKHVTETVTYRRFLAPGAKMGIGTPFPRQTCKRRRRSPSLLWVWGQRF